MAFHQFGFMEHVPCKGERFDRYEPQRYGCIAVSDDLFDEVFGQRNRIRAFSHTIDCPCYGLEETGITLIPPDSVRQMAEIIGNCRRLSELSALLAEARRTQKWLIHFGI